MKRRTFLFAGLAATAAVSVPLIYHYKIRNEHFDSGNPLTTPDVLAHFCDEKALLGIGEKYLAQVPAERDSHTLTRLLETDSDGKRNSSLKGAEMAQFLSRKAKADFGSGKLVYIGGWMLSQTEARQCALLSLSTKSK